MARRRVGISPDSGNRHDSHGRENEGESKARERGEFLDFPSRPALLLLILAGFSLPPALHSLTPASNKQTKNPQPPSSMDPIGPSAARDDAMATGVVAIHLDPFNGSDGVDHHRTTAPWRLLYYPAFLRSTMHAR
ncbi:hypothetical protein BO71DRAFT_180781 [Aspergillus ellipticus CBS 707.79]|uniref:Uncharacterized protein n=1 Tax=Aspergillus ellipticus CBS 707.79 TaxID=1448320 RepID=A0A319EX91_9EURO|nr:hypothetical protein BO71DRAFT_180781 [Aspergillus ellipticus CBS 707.79]